MANTFVKIASVTVGAGGSSSIVFSSIPQTYTDLYLVTSMRASTNAGVSNMTFYINNSTANQTSRYLFGNGSTAASGTGTNWDIGIQDTLTTSNVFTTSFLYIPNYTSSNNKSASLEYVSENNATTASQVMEALLWSNIAAITGLRFDFTGIVQYSTATLYGIKSS